MLASKKTLTKKQFNILSFTWGLPLTLFGIILSLIMRLLGKKPKKYGWIKYYEFGKQWGGQECGRVFIRDKQSSEHISMHEFGHAIQNCFYGPFMPFIVNAPSTIRYWIRRIGGGLGIKPKRAYDDIWFEREATELGKKYMAMINSDKKDEIND